MWTRKTYSSLIWGAGVGLILAVAWLVRLPLLSGSFWLDEAAQALESIRPWHQQFEIAADFQPPQFHLIVHALSSFSHQEMWLRQASLVPGLISVIMTMLIVRRRSGDVLAWMAGALLAVSQLHVFFSQELRPYMLGVMWATISWWLLESAVLRWQSRVKIWWALLAITNALGLLSSYVFLFFLPAQLLAVALWYRHDMRKVFASLSVSGVLFGVWWIEFLEQWRVGQLLRQKLPGWEEVVSLPFLKALPLTLMKFVVGYIPVDSHWSVIAFGVVWWFLLLGAVLMAVWKSRRGWMQGEPEPLWFWGTLFAGALLLAWIFSLVTPVVEPKRLLYLLPILVGIMAMVIRDRPRWIGLALAFGLWQLVALQQYWTQQTLQREDWRTVVREVERRFAHENTALVFAFDAPFAPWQWYMRDPFDTYSTGTAPTQNLEHVTSILTGIEEYQNVLVFDYLRDLTDPGDYIRLTLQEMGYEEIGAIVYPGIGPIRVFSKSQFFALGP